MRLLARLRYSLTARLLLLFLATAAALAIILGITLGLAVSHQFRDVMLPHLTRYLDYLQRDIGQPPDVARAAALARQLPLTIRISGPGIDWSSDGRGSVPAGVVFDHAHERPGYRLAYGERGDDYVLRATAGDYQIVYEIPRRASRAHGRWIGLAAMAALLLVVYLCYRAIRWLFRPVADIQAGVQRIGGGELDYRIPIRRADELGTLTASINAMTEEIRKMLDAKRQLLLAVSHELRSPVTRARVSLALLEDSPERTRLQEDLQEMEHLIGDLLEAERLNTRHAVLNREPVAVNALVRELLDEHFAGRSIAFDPAPDDPYVLLDPARIRLLLKNLLVNALRHTPAGRPAPSLHLGLTDSVLTLSVDDHGEGIAPEHLARLTEPFYRVDASRQRRTGGYGLGLYLCRMIAEAHGGELRIVSRPEQGSEVRVTIPLGGE